MEYGVSDGCLSTNKYTLHAPTNNKINNENSLCVISGLINQSVKQLSGWI